MVERMFGFNRKLQKQIGQDRVEREDREEGEDR